MRQCLSGLQCRPPTVHDSASLWGTRLILQWRRDTVGSGRRRAGLCYLMCYWGRSLCDGNALFHLVFMQCILYFFSKFRLLSSVKTSHARCIRYLSGLRYLRPCLQLAPPTLASKLAAALLRVARVTAGPGKPTAQFMIPVLG